MYRFARTERMNKRRSVVCLFFGRPKGRRKRSWCTVLCVDTEVVVQDMCIGYSSTVMLLLFHSAAFVKTILSGY